MAGHWHHRPFGRRRILLCRTKRGLRSELGIALLGFALRREETALVWGNAVKLRYGGQPGSAKSPSEAPGPGTPVAERAWIGSALTIFNSGLLSPVRWRVARYAGVMSDPG